MNLQKIVTVGLSLLLSLRSTANLPKDPGEYLKWQSSLLASIGEQEHLPPETAIPKLGRWVMQMSLPNNLEKGERPVFHAAQAALLAIPGHAEYFVNEIKRERAAATSYEEMAARDGRISWSNYDRVRSEAFDTLEHLPSVEAVHALGEFLSDEEDPDKLRPDDGTIDALGPGSNSGLAALALRALIQDDPVKSEHDYLERGEAKAWQQWYEQIKAGNRTFRFEGNPRDYDLNGPASKEKLSLIERDHKRDDERAAGQRKTSAAPVDGGSTAHSSKPSAMAAILTGLALITGALWYFLKSRRTA